MKLVEIYKLSNDGDQILILTCRLEGSTVLCEGQESFVRALETDGIKDYSDLNGAERLYPSNGLKFLENLKYAFKSNYINATDIIEKP